MRSPRILVALFAIVACLARPGSAWCEPALRSGPLSPVIDGDLGEWPEGTLLRADGHDLFVRVSLPGEITLQAAPYSLGLLLDVDGDPSTGSGLDGVQGDTSDAGAELAVVFSPPGVSSRSVGRGNEGVAALLLPDRGQDRAAEPVPHADLDLVFSPTYAAKDFEVRLSRRPRGQPELAAALTEGRVSARLVGVDREDSLAWSKPLGTVELPSLGAEGPRVAARLPARPPDAIRIVSWNVLFATPMREPKPFARILRALDPDVVLVQEWERADAARLRTWFEEHVSGQWHALDSPGWGVAVISRGPLERLGPARVERPAEAPPDTFRPDQSLRLAAAVVETRLGPIAVASMHLKCCGPAGGLQDRARIAEAGRIRQTLADALEALGEARPTVRVFGGDLNLVGSREPLDVLKGGLARDGRDLEVARIEVLGDRALYTWRGVGSRYSPGRLDFLTFGGASAAGAYAVDTARLSQEVRAAAGLEADDSAASDHLALVLDVRPDDASSRKVQ